MGLALKEKEGTRGAAIRKIAHKGGRNTSSEALSRGRTGI